MKQDREPRNWRAKRDETQSRRKTASHKGDRQGARTTKPRKNEQMRQKQIQHGRE